MIEDGLVDLYLRPPLEEFKVLDFSVCDQMREIGYAYGVTEIRAWRSTRDRGSILNAITDRGTIALSLSNENGHRLS